MATVGTVATLLFMSVNQVTKQRTAEAMTLEEMELALAKIDAMIGLLKKKLEAGANHQAAEDMARYQQWRDDLDVQIRVERIKRDAYRDPKMRS